MSEGLINLITIKLVKATFLSEIKENEVGEEGTSLVTINLMMDKTAGKNSIKKMDLDVPVEFVREEMNDSIFYNDESGIEI